MSILYRHSVWLRSHVLYTVPALCLAEESCGVHCTGTQVCLVNVKHVILSKYEHECLVNVYLLYSLYTSKIVWLMFTCYTQYIQSRLSGQCLPAILSIYKHECLVNVYLLYSLNTSMSVWSMLNM